MRVAVKYPGSNILHLTHDYFCIVISIIGCSCVLVFLCSCVPVFFCSCFLVYFISWSTVEPLIVDSLK